MSKTSRIQDYDEIYYDTITDYENYEIIIFEQDINLVGYDINYGVTYSSGFRHCPFLIVKSIYSSPKCTTWTPTQKLPPIKAFTSSL